MIDVTYNDRLLNITFPMIVPATDKLDPWKPDAFEEARKVFKHELCPKLMQLDKRLRQPMIVKDDTSQKGYIVLKPFYLYDEPVCVWFTHYTNQSADRFLDNKAQKYVVDALHVSHIIPKDTNDYVSLMISQESYHGKPYTQVKVFPAKWLEIGEMTKHLVMRYDEIFPRDNDVHVHNHDLISDLFHHWEEKTDRLLSILCLYIDTPEVILHFAHTHNQPYDVDNLIHRFVVKKLRERRVFDSKTNVRFYITGRYVKEVQPYTEVYLIPQTKSCYTGQQIQKNGPKNLLTKQTFGSVLEESKIV